MIAPALLATMMVLAWMVLTNIGTCNFPTLDICGFDANFSSLCSCVCTSEFFGVRCQTYTPTSSGTNTLADPQVSVTVKLTFALPPDSISSIISFVADLKAYVSQVTGIPVYRIVIVSVGGSDTITNSFATRFVSILDRFKLFSASTDVVIRIDPPAADAPASEQGAAILPEAAFAALVTTVSQAAATGQSITIGTFVVPPPAVKQECADGSFQVECPTKNDAWQDNIRKWFDEDPIHIVIVAVPSGVVLVVAVLLCMCCGCCRNAFKCRCRSRPKKKNLFDDLTGLHDIEFATAAPQQVVELPSSNFVDHPDHRAPIRDSSNISISTSSPAPSSTSGSAEFLPGDDAPAVELPSSSLTYDVS